MKQERNSNIEIFRIICMLMIVAHHYSVHGFMHEQLSYCFNKYVIDIISLGGKLGVNGFVLITGYFMVNSSFQFKKILYIEGQILFYSLLFLFMFTVVIPNTVPIGKPEIVSSVFPTTYNAYWFTTHYIVLLLISGWLNRLIEALPKESYKKLLIVCLLIWCVIPTVILNPFAMAYQSLGWFVILYLIGGYVRLYQKDFSLESKVYAIRVIILSMILLIITCLFNFVGNKLHSDFIYNYHFSFENENNILILAIAFEMFLLFLNRKEFCSRIINEISATTLGIYLIHDNLLVRPYIWGNIFRNQEYFNSPYLLLHACLVIILVFLCCSLIDWLRMKTIHKIWISFIDRCFGEK